MGVTAPCPRAEPGLGGEGSLPAAGGPRVAHARRSVHAGGCLPLGIGWVACPVAVGWA